MSRTLALCEFPRRLNWMTASGGSFVYLRNAGRWTVDVGHPEVQTWLAPTPNSHNSHTYENFAKKRPATCK